MTSLTIIGGGLAGSEAAWQAALRGIKVRLYEMRPAHPTGAHLTGDLAELVCSNSLRSLSLENAAGLLKEEMRLFGSLVYRAATDTRVPAGSSLAVDREQFSQVITRSLEQAGVRIERQEVLEIPQDGVPVVVATGPLPSEAMARAIQSITGRDALSFYDAVAPIVDGSTVDPERTFWASRYGKGGQDYLNCPMDKETYHRFVEAVLQAETVPLRDFEEIPPFEGCMPIEDLAARGPETLAHGPMRPVGLEDPRTGRRAYAVVQLRQDNVSASLLNMVGFQTKMTYTEQERVFRMIPGLEKAEFFRFGSLHRNAFVNAPLLLRPTLQTRAVETVFFAGQMTGVEGYVESAASGMIAGHNAARMVRGRPLRVPPPTTALGALLHYITHADADGFQPMHVNFGTGGVGRPERRAVAGRFPEGPGAGTGRGPPAARKGGTSGGVASSSSSRR